MNNQTPKFLQHILPTTGIFIWMVTFFGVILLGPKMINIDGDLGRHLTLGGTMIDSWKIPIQDIFSHTMTGQPLTPHEWLSQVIYALAERILGLNGVILVCALVIATSFWLVYQSARAEDRSVAMAILVTFLAVVTSSLHWLARPHIFTFLLLAGWMLALTKLRKRYSRSWWLLPVLMLPWANLHGAFLAGFVTWFVYGIGVAWDSFWNRTAQGENPPLRFWQFYFLGGFTAFLASLLNPAGIGIWKTSLGYIGNQYLVSHTMEYLSPNFHNPGFLPFLLFIGVLVIVLGLSKKRMDSGMLFTSAAWLIMGLYSARNIPLFAIVAAPLLVQGLSDLLTDASSHLRIAQKIISMDAQIRRIESSLKGMLLPVACIVIVAIGFQLGARFDLEKRGNSFDPQVFPVEAVNWLEENPQEGEMFNYFTWGGYLLYRQFPEKRVFIDAQTDFYGEEMVRKYERVIDLQEGWENILAEYRVDWAILPMNAASAHALQSELGWKIVYEDSTAVILHR